MTLNGQGVDLDIFTEAGRAYPAGIDAADLRFQHFAFPTPDAAASVERALQAGATLISNGGPVRLPAASGGVIAVKFRDPEGHPMEFLQFATQPAATVAIDHSAISVSHVEASIQFYTLRGLKTGGRTLNQGSTQAALDGLERPLVDVVPLLPKVEAPHLELLGYRHPHPTAKDPLRTGDVAATRIVWASEVDALLEDPDGHFHQLSAAE
jgi:catechol 2,3-dioxygenase-like lactoylglutathione lyase family enzyme